jgi:tetratricopeptide (TPR) repeat protein
MATNKTGRTLMVRLWHRLVRLWHRLPLATKVAGVMVTSAVTSLVHFWGWFDREVQAEASELHISVGSLRYQEFLRYQEWNLWILLTKSVLAVLANWCLTLALALGGYFVLKRMLREGTVNRPFIEGPSQGTAGRIVDLAFWIVIVLSLFNLFNLFQPSSSRGPRSVFAYQQAIDLLEKADYPAAEEALKGFIRQYPNDRWADDARYWLGETYYARGNYAEAVAAFATGTHATPIWEGP